MPASSVSPGDSGGSGDSGELVEVLVEPLGAGVVSLVDSARDGGCPADGAGSVPLGEPSDEADGDGVVPPPAQALGAVSSAAGAIAAVAAAAARARRGFMPV
ncbi:hypothetical protein [Streptomyces sp. NPDC048392]|uniref:hypothetical protein n=1 Tax=Streptomyces sp. NPDC048392 TaxID=3365543 RepID=UPI003710AFD0